MFSLDSVVKLHLLHYETDVHDKCDMLLFIFVPLEPSVSHLSVLVINLWRNFVSDSEQWVIVDFLFIGCLMCICRSTLLFKSR
jgi:hypothetical protein